MDNIAIIISIIAIGINILTIFANMGLFDNVLDRIDDFIYWIQECIEKIKRHCFQEDYTIKNKNLQGKE